MPGIQTDSFRRVEMRKLIRHAAEVSGFALVFAASTASAQDTVRVRGTIEKVEGQTLTVKSRDGAELKVVLADIDEPLLDATTRELSAGSNDVIGVPTDVSLPESVEHLRDATLEQFGAVHLVCNNAGIPSGSDGALWQHHVNDWRWAVDVNVFGVINGINTFVPVLVDQGGPGHVMNTSSSNGTFAPL